MSRAARATKAKILLVEDDQDIRDLMQELLQVEGYDVGVASNGQLALEYLERLPDADLPRLILLDLMMPVMDGIGFREAQERDARLAPIPVVILSADALLDEKKKTMNVRAALKKPVDFPRLFEVIRQETAPS